MLHGAPHGWTPPSEPEGWKVPKPWKNTACPEDFESVDDPGQWSDFTCCQAKCTTKGKSKCIHHCLPTGVVPVPEANGKRQCGGCDFHCRGWKKPADEPNCRSGASKENPFPAERKSSLCGAILAKLGLTTERMPEDDGAPDAPFFHQLLLPMCNIALSGIEDDPRKPFHLKVSTFTNLHAIKNLNMGRSHCHNCKLRQEASLWMCGTTLLA